MKYLLISIFLLCLGCREDGITPSISGVNFPSIDRNATQLDCPQAQDIIQFLENDNLGIKQHLALIHYGLLPDTGCSRLQSCTAELNKQLSFNLLQIQQYQRYCP